LQGADEIVVLDISATLEARKTRVETVKKIRRVLSIPLTVGGGVSTADDAQLLLLSGKFSHRGDAQKIMKSFLQVLIK
jgi:cyclase